MNNLYYGIYIYLLSGSVVGTRIEKNTISSSRYYGIHIGSGSITGTSIENNRICSVSGIPDIYDWQCSAYSPLGNICNYHQNNGCSSTICGNPACS